MSSTERVTAEPDLSASALYFNRELSWLEFNARVLELAEDESLPLLERVKFCAIVSSNLDEFFMVRVAGLHDQIEAGIQKPREDGRTPSATLEEIRRIVREHTERQTRCLELELRPAGTHEPEYHCTESHGLGYRQVEHAGSKRGQNSQCEDPDQCLAQEDRLPGH